MKFNFKHEINSLQENFRSLDKNIITILISVVILQAFSYQFASTKYFFDSGLYELVSDSFADLYAKLYWFGLDIFLLFLIPVLLIRFYFHDKIKNYGLITGDAGFGLKVSLLIIIIMAGVLWFVSASEEILTDYPSFKSAEGLSSLFLVYQAALLFYIIAWEFIWRGYMLFGLEKKFGYYAVFIQMIPFVILHNGKPFIEMLGAIPGGIFLGILALRTRSIYYGVIIHFSIMFFIDLFSILRHNDNITRNGIVYLTDIFSHLF